MPKARPQRSPAHCAFPAYSSAAARSPPARPRPQPKWQSQPQPRPQPQPQPKPRPTLLTLSAELRHQIYTHLFTASTLTLQSWLPPSASADPRVLGVAAITATSRLLRAESLPLFHRTARVLMPEGLKLLGQLRRRSSETGGGACGRGNEAEELGVGKGIGRVFDAGRLRFVEVEVNPEWIKEVRFEDVVRTFPAAREVSVKCLVCDRFKVEAEEFGLRGFGGRAGESVGKDEAGGLRGLDGAVVLRETVRWVDHGRNTGEGAARWWAEVRVEVRMRLYATMAAGGVRLARGLWKDLGVIAVGIGGKETERVVCLEVDGERLPVATELDWGTSRQSDG